MATEENQKSLWLNIKQLSIASSNIIDKDLFEKEEIEGIQLSKLFHFSEIRNSYYGHLSDQDHGSYSFHYSYDLIKKQVESYRKKGSQWSIYEVPCIALKGKKYAIVFTPHDPRSVLPFVELNNPAKEIDVNIKTIKDLFNKITEIVPWVYFQAFILETQNLSCLESPLKRYNSITDGPYYLSYLSNKRDQPSLEHLLGFYSYLHDFISDKFKKVY